MQVKTGLSLLNQQVVTEAPTTEASVITDVHPVTAYLEKFTEPSIEEFDKYQMGPLITAENTAPAMDTLGRLWNLAQHPYDVVKGSAMFASEIPGFIGGLASAIGQVPIEILKGGTVLDWYNASAKNMQTISGLWHRGVSAPLGKLLEIPEKMGEELAQTMFGVEPEVHKDESELVGEIFMVPYTASSVPLHGLADSPTWDDHPNVRGLLKFGADALGLVTMGLVLKGGPVMAARKVDPIVKKAHEIDGKEKVIEVSGLDEIAKTAQKKVLDAEKVQLELEIESLKKELDHEKLAKENLKEKGKEVEGIKEGIETEVIREERLKFAEEAAKEIPEEKVKTGIKLIKKMPKEPPKPVTDIDLQTGTKEPVELSTEKSPFRETPERTQAMKDVYAERVEAVRSNPELMTNKLLNDVNRWLDGEELPVEKAKNDLSELAARADELRKMFRDPAAFDHWKSTTSSAATWARNADRLKIERTPREYQERFPEKTVHEDWDKANRPRFVFEGAGDILRELQKDYADPGYIKEKLNRINEFIEGELSGKISGEDSLSAARKYAPEKLDRLIKQYKEQPVETGAESIAKDAIISLLEGNFKKAEDLYNKVSENLDVWKERKDRLKIERPEGLTLYTGL
ncbi:MAG: hypothetical protein IMF19_09325, partial [Proteobacteria bacterium]|nr:hypothetical protein [Pseudomonadota bacterium]